MSLSPAEQRVGLACRPGPVDDELAATLAYAAALRAPVLRRWPDDLAAASALSRLTVAEPPRGSGPAAPVTAEPTTSTVILTVDRLDDMAPVATSMLSAGQASAVAVYARTSEEVARAAERLPPLSYVATALSVADRRGDPVVAAAREQGARPILLSPLGGGRLTQQAAADAAPGLAGLFELATWRSVGPARLALAWLLACYPDALVLPRTSRVTHVEMNLAAAELELTRAELDELTALVD